MAAIFMQFGSNLDNVHPKIIMFVGLATISAGLFLSSIVESLLAFMFTYSMLVGFGYGFAYMLPIRNAWLFYPERKGMVAGIILLAFSIGAIIWMQLSFLIINPDNISATLVVTISTTSSTTENLYPADSEVV